MERGSEEDELLNRFVRIHCKRCAELGHWKAGCVTTEAQGASSTRGFSNTRTF